MKCIKVPQIYHVQLLLLCLHTGASIMHTGAGIEGQRIVKGDRKHRKAKLFYPNFLLGTDSSVLVIIIFSLFLPVLVLNNSYFLVSSL